MIKREHYLSRIRSLSGSDFIKIIFGLHRCGKTSLLKSIIEELKNQGVKKENIIYISFESAEYRNISTEKQLDETVLKLAESIEGKIYFFFDEIQQVESWQRCVNSYRVSFDCDIYITSSSSRLLSGELATLLAGRYIKINLYPFSFKEVLQYKKEIEGLELTGDIINHAFNEYILFGGMPGLLAIKDESTKISALLDIFDSVIVDNILSKHTINDVTLFKRFTYYLMNSTGQTFSKTAIMDCLKSENKKTTRNTVSNFTHYLAEALFCNKAERLDISDKRLLKTGEKYYLADHGFHHAFADNNIDCLESTLENIVYMELLRRGFSLKVGKIANKEIDFVCEKHGRKVYVQVAYLLSAPEVIEREFSPLFSVPDKYDAYVLSMDRFDMSHDGVKHKNIIDFLLDDEIT